MKARAFFVMVPMIAGLLIGLLTGCGGPTRPAPVPDSEAGFVSLLELQPTSLTIAADSRGGVQPPSEVPLAGPWKYMATSPSGMHKWNMPIPMRPRGLFFHQVEPDMELRTRDGKLVRYGRNPSGPELGWYHTRTGLVVYKPKKGQAPAAGDFVFSYPKATERERALNYAWQPEGTQKWDFVRTSIHHDWNTRKGLLLNAPAKVTWELEVPKAAELLMAPGLNEPELNTGTGSDGATLVVSVDANGTTSEAARIELKPGEFEQTRVDLSRWSGQQVALSLVVEPGATPDFDYAFVGDPMVASRKEKPRRVVMVFVDTLRADHLGMYGYQRDTSKKLDAWAKDAAVFENARSVAPWTLPSGRTLVTGRHPEFYHSAETVQHALHDEGFVSAMIAGNVYLSTNFEMARDWGWHKVGMWPRAEMITDDALAWLAATEGHDVIIQAHYMDCHLPYLEPAAYRGQYAGEDVAGLGEEFYLPDVRAVRATAPVQKYVTDRYDNNVRYATDQVARLIEHLDEDDVVLFFADHGEELWDHGGFEHGHQLYDELLHVPLVIKAPGVTGHRVTEPASLLDITPTILDALGVEDDEVRDGISLLPAARGEPGAGGPLADRSLAFGRPLYGGERWGVLTEHEGSWKKWTTHDGRQEVYDVEADRAERNNLLRGKPYEEAEPYHEALGEALHTRAGVALRVNVGWLRMPSPEDMLVDVEVPGGVANYWVEHDPIDRSFADATIDTPEVADGVEPVHTIQAIVPAGATFGGTLWVVPVLPVSEAAARVTVHVSQGDRDAVLRADETRPPVYAHDRVWLASTNVGKRNIRYGFGVARVPPEGSKGVVAVDEEMNSALEAIGYKHDDRNGHDGEGAPEEE